MPASLMPQPLEEEVSVRGTTFKLRELSIGEYDDIVRKATTKQTNALGEETETIDNALLLKMMVLRSSVDPKLTPETLAALPMRVVVKLNSTVNRMHYGDEPEEVTKPDAESEDEPAQGHG